MKILVMNAGSSTHKAGLYEITGSAPPEEPSPALWSAQIEWGEAEGAAEMEVTTEAGAVARDTAPSGSRSAALARMLEMLWSGATRVVERPDAIDMVGQRVVHGGRQYQQSVPITEEVKAAIAELAPLAPAHNPAALESIKAVEERIGPVPQVAVFDTAFHSRIAETAALYPGPYAWAEQGIRRYGFHGISHQYCAHRAARLLQRDLHSLKLITCHLGNGCSLAAIRDGTSVDTTMGYTPLEGLMMGSRSGSIDPGILLYLMRHEGYTADRLDRILNRESGLRGISGLSEDMRQIDAAIREGNARAQLALDLYIHRVRRNIGAMLASLGGLDALVFAAGVGEHSAPVRAGACAGFEFLGLQIDPQKNQGSPIDQDISVEGSRVRVLVIRTQEEWAIAEECWRLANAERG